ncbi:MAG: DUF4116 domain-containing protein [Flavobacteriales bacterium]
MEKENSTLFETLLLYKKKGYTYITSQCAESWYTGYDLAVQDFYEGTIDYEPNYMQWLHEYNVDVEDFITFHNDLLVFGNKKLEKYDWEHVELNKEYDDSFEERCKLLFYGCTNTEIRYVDCLAFSIWNLDFENESDQINDFSSINNLFSNPKRGYSYMGAWDVSFGDNCWNDSIVLNFLKPELWSDESFILELVRSKFFSKLNNTFILSEIGEDLKKNEKFVQKITEIDPQLVKFFDSELNTNKAIALKSLVNMPSNLKMISVELTSDPSFIKEAFRIDPNIYKYLSEEFRSNKELTSMAIEKNGKNLQFLPESLKADKELLMTALNNSREEVKKRSDGTVYIIKSGELLQFTADEIKKNKAFILKTLKSNINCFQYADETLISDEEVMMTAINLDQRNFQYVTKEIIEKIKSNRSQLIKLIRNGIDLDHFFEYQNQCTDKELVLLALEFSSCGQNIISEELKKDRDLALNLVLKTPGDIRYLAEEFQNDKEFIIAAVSKWEYYYERLDPIYRKDKDIAIAALKKNKNYIEGLLPGELFEHEEIKKILSQE